MTTTQATEADYHKHEEACEAAFTALSAERDPLKRAELLDVLATNDDHQARLHPVLVGPDPNPRENGRDHAETLASSAVLLRALAATERALATGKPRVPATDERIEEVAKHLLDDLAISPNPAKRAWLCYALSDAVEPVVGGQAVERLYNQGCRYEDVSRLV
jgi:hypothetical protein